MHILQTTVETISNAKCSGYQGSFQIESGSISQRKNRCQSDRNDVLKPTQNMVEFFREPTLRTQMYKSPTNGCFRSLRSPPI